MKKTRTVTPSDDRDHLQEATRDVFAEGHANVLSHEALEAPGIVQAGPSSDRHPSQTSSRWKLPSGDTKNPWTLLEYAYGKGE